MTPQELIALAFADGDITAEEGQAVLDSGASLSEIAAISGVPLSEIQGFMEAKNLSGPTGTPTLNIGGNFNNNPGASGFTDLNPAVNGADTVMSSTSVTIPEFIKPFLADSANFSQGALQSLGQLLVQDNALTSPFNSLQTQGQNMALDFAGGAGGFLPLAQSALSEIADSSDIVDVFNQGRDLLTSPNATATSALEQTAGGEFLFGNPGFDRAVQASIAQALPHINSGFSLQGGSGALSGGLRDAAIAEVAANSFAREFGNERNRQMGAANSLVSQNQAAGSTLTSLANADRGRQLIAATQLPQIGLLGSDIVSGVGNQLQSQDERSKLGQIQAMQQLLGSSFGKINPTVLFGNSQRVPVNDNTAGGLLGGALTGAQIGNLVPGIGTGIGALAGGLLGAFG